MRKLLLLKSQSKTGVTSINFVECCGWRMCFW